jgi:hypothetical protein
VNFGTGSLAAGCWITSSNGYLKEHADGSPSLGVFFGTVTPPGGATAFLYLVLYRHARGCSFGEAGNRQSSTSGGFVAIVDGLAIDAAAARLGAHLNIDPEAGKLTREEYTLNEQPIDISRGRLFLADFTARPARWEQVNLELPRGLPRDIDRETVRRVAEGEVPALLQKHRAVADFFK